MNFKKSKPFIGRVLVIGARQVHHRITYIRVFSYLIILISSHCNKISLWEHIGPESAIGELQNVIGSHNMKPGLVFMHRVQDGLKNSTEK